MKYNCNAFLDLVYPSLCLYCGLKNDSESDIFCLNCRSKTTPTDLHLRQPNEFTRHFDGRIEIAAGSALYYYSREGIIATLIELIKYKDRKDLALQLGSYYGKMLRESVFFHEAELIIPVPLHESRLRVRGFNQSEEFARGLAGSMNLRYSRDHLIRTGFTETQTTKDRQERIQNIQGVFQLQNPKELSNRHVLLVDDVLTTGATLESCAMEIYKANPASIRMATMAMGF